MIKENTENATSPERDAEGRDCQSPLPKHRRRLSWLEKQSRVFEVLELIFSGKQPEETIEIIRAKWGLGQIQASKHITLARLVIAEELTTPRNERIAFHLAVSRHLYQKAREAGDLHLALDVLIRSALKAAAHSDHSRRALATAIGLFLQFLDRERGNQIPRNLARAARPFAESRQNGKQVEWNLKRPQIAPISRITQAAPLATRSYFRSGAFL